MKIRIIIMLALASLALTGCTSFKFQISQEKGILIEMKGAPPTLYKLVSYDKTSDDVKAFDLFHFQAEGAEAQEPEGTGTVLRADEEDGL